MSRPRHKGIDDRSSSREQPGEWLPGRLAPMRKLAAVEGSDTMGTAINSILGCSPAEYRMINILARIKRQ